MSATMKNRDISFPGLYAALNNKTSSMIIRGIKDSIHDTMSGFLTVYAAEWERVASQDKTIVAAAKHLVVTSSNKPADQGPFVVASENRGIIALSMPCVQLQDFPFSTLLVTAHNEALAWKKLATALLLGRVEQDGAMQPLCLSIHCKTFVKDDFAAFSVSPSTPSIPVVSGVTGFSNKPTPMTL